MIVVVVVVLVSSLKRNLREKQRSSWYSTGSLVLSFFALLSLRDTRFKRIDFHHLGSLEVVLSIWQ